MFSLTVSLPFLKISTVPTSVTQLKLNCIQEEDPSPGTLYYSSLGNGNMNHWFRPTLKGGKGELHRLVGPVAIQPGLEDSLISTPALMPWAHRHGTFFAFQRRKPPDPRYLSVEPFFLVLSQVLLLSPLQEQP